MPRTARDQSATGIYQKKCHENRHPYPGACPHDYVTQVPVPMTTSVPMTTCSVVAATEKIKNQGTVL